MSIGRRWTTPLRGAVWDRRSGSVNRAARRRPTARLRRALLDEPAAARDSPRGEGRHAHGHDGPLRGGSGRTTARNWSARPRSTSATRARPRSVSQTDRMRRSSGSSRRSSRRRRTSPSTSREVADGERFRRSARSAIVVVPPSASAYRAASWVKPRRSSPSCAANPITSSRQRAFPKATRSESSRGFWMRDRAAATGARRTSSAIASSEAVETRAGRGRPATGRCDRRGRGWGIAEG